jgi:hypothetical protein
MIGRVYHQGDKTVEYMQAKLRELDPGNLSPTKRIGMANSVYMPTAFSILIWGDREEYVENAARELGLAL